MSAKKNILHSALRLGKDAIVTCLLNKLHPSKVIRDKCPDAVSNQRLDNAVVLIQSSSQRQTGASVEKKTKNTHH